MKGVRVAAVVRDLLFGSRILEAASRAGAELIRLDSPADLPPPDQIDLVLVDWGDRSSDWGEALVTWIGSATEPPRVILFGPHTDIEAHVAARQHSLGPMVARSKLAQSLPKLMGSDRG